MVKGEDDGGAQETIDPGRGQKRKMSGDLRDSRREVRSVNKVFDEWAPNRKPNRFQTRAGESESDWGNRASSIFERAVVGERDQRWEIQRQRGR